MKQFGNVGLFNTVCVSVRKLLKNMKLGSNRSYYFTKLYIQKI